MVNFCESNLDGELFILLKKGGIYECGSTKLLTVTESIYCAAIYKKINIEMKVLSKILQSQVT